MLNNPATSLIPQVRRETRVKDAANGDVAYTGYGFAPKGIIIFARGPTSTLGSIGSSEPALTEVALGLDPAAKSYGQIVMHGVAAANQNAVVKTYDSDGFTLTWTKVGAGSAVDVDMHVYAFK